MFLFVLVVVVKPAGNHRSNQSIPAARALLHLRIHLGVPFKEIPRSLELMEAQHLRLQRLQLESGCSSRSLSSFYFILFSRRRRGLPDRREILSTKGNAIVTSRASPWQLIEFGLRSVGPHARKTHRHTHTYPRARGRTHEHTQKDASTDAYAHAHIDAFMQNTHTRTQTHKHARTHTRT